MLVRTEVAFDGNLGVSLLLRKEGKLRDYFSHR